MISISSLFELYNNSDEFTIFYQKARIYFDEFLQKDFDNFGKTNFPWINKIHKIIDFFKKYIIEKAIIQDLILFQTLLENKTKHLESKREGIVFTRKKICRIINRETFRAFSKKKLTSFETQVNPLGSRSFEKIFSQSIIILDPSCGLGNFLIDLLFFLSENLFSFSIERSDNNTDGILPYLENVKKLLFFCKTSLYGMDTDKESVKITKSAIIIVVLLFFLKFLDVLNNYLTKNLVHIESSLPKNIPPNKLDEVIAFLIEFPNNLSELEQNLDEHIVQGNFLLLEDISHLKPRFDIILGNPPYIRVHRINDKIKKNLRENFFSPLGDFDIYICFIEQALKFLKKSGIIGFIVPEKFLLRRYAKKLRLLLLLNTVPLKFIDLSRCKNVFNADIYSMIIILRKITQDLIYNIVPHQTEQEHPLEWYYYRIEAPLFKNYNNIATLIEDNFIIDNENSLKDLKMMDNRPNILGFKRINVDSGSVIILKFGSGYFRSFLKNEDYKFEIYFNLNVYKLSVLFSHYLKISDLIEEDSVFCGTPRAKDYAFLSKGLNSGALKPNKDTLNIKYIIAKNVLPFNIIWGFAIKFKSKRFYRPLYNLKKGPFSSKIIAKFKLTPKILIKATSKRIVAALDEEGAVFVGIYALILKYKNETPYIHLVKKYINEKILICLLNSDLINYYITHKWHSFMLRNKYLSINSDLIKSLPIPIPHLISTTPSKLEQYLNSKRNNFLKIEELYDEIYLLLKNIEKKYLSKILLLIDSYKEHNNLKSEYLNKLFNFFINNLKENYLFIPFDEDDYSALVQNKFDEKITSEFKKNEFYEPDLRDLNKLLLEFKKDLYNLKDKIEELNKSVYSLYEIPANFEEEIRGSFLSN